MSNKPADSRRDRLDAALDEIRTLFESHTPSKAPDPDAHDGVPAGDDWYQTLYVTGVHLHQTLDPDELLTRLRELLINVLGVARFRLYLRVPGSEILQAVADQTPERPADDLVAGIEDPVVQVALSGTAHYAEDSAPGSRNAPIACVPLRQEDGVIGVIRVDALLPQQGHLGRRGRELLEHLGAHAAQALLSVGAWHRLRRDTGDGSTTRNEVLTALLGSVDDSLEERAR